MTATQTQEYVEVQKYVPGDEPYVAISEANQPETSVAAEIDEYNNGTVSREIVQGDISSYNFDEIYMRYFEQYYGPNMARSEDAVQIGINFETNIPIYVLRGDVGTPYRILGEKDIKKAEKVKRYERALGQYMVQREQSTESGRPSTYRPLQVLLEFTRTLFS